MVSAASRRGWFSRVYTLAPEMFARKDVESVVGLGGAAGGARGMVNAPLAGYTWD